MRKPGFKVMHEANIDTHSTCLTFVLCLRAVKTWSDAHPGHVPIMIDVEMKDPVGDAGDLRRARRRDPLGAVAHRSHHPRRRARHRSEPRPRRSHARLADARRVRGRIMFMLDNENFAKIELAGHPSLRGRILFAPSSPGDDDAAVAKLNDPIADAAKIKAALAANMLVRTRADADTVQARANARRCAQAALTGGAQFVSTDYEVPDPRFGPYVVKIPGGNAGALQPRDRAPACRPPTSRTRSCSPESERLARDERDHEWAATAAESNKACVAPTAGQARTFQSDGPSDRRAAGT